MKKCPFCKAELADHARFCIYCMKPLNEKQTAAPQPRKKRGWLLALVALLAIAVLVFLMLNRGEQPPAQIAETSAEGATTLWSSSAATEDMAFGDTTASADTQAADLPEQKQEASAQPTETQPVRPLETQPVQTYPTEQKQPQATQPGATSAPTDPVPPETTVPEETQIPTQSAQPDTPAAAAVYTYRAARAGDDFYANYVNGGNDIVITGIAQPSANGVYDIPSYIDGKRVIAIVANAFTGSNAKAVYVPTTVKNIWNHAFAGCSLTDIYFRGSAIYTESMAFSGSVTIHCTAACSDRNFRYYKNTAPSYGAVWEEWNG